MMNLVKYGFNSFKKESTIVPPSAEMEGVDMITEGIITLGTVAELLSRKLDRDDIPHLEKQNAAETLAEHFLNSDRITFIVRTKINEAHQDPSMPVELEIRRNIVKRIASLLKEKYLKEVLVQFF
jgi:hypothetical protein